MIAATRRWLRRNRNGIAIGVGVLGASYVAVQYVVNKLSEAREAMNSDRISRENLRRRFEQNQTDCTFTVLALLPTATENILEVLPVEDLTRELQLKKAERLGRGRGDATVSDLSSSAPSTNEDDGRSLASFQSESFVYASQLVEGSGNGEENKSKARRTKAQIWNEVKIQSITRSFTLLYTLSLLTILTRIQLNLLGRKNYLQSVLTLASPPSNSTTIILEDHDSEQERLNLGNDFETNRAYLTFSWWLLHRGWQKLLMKVENAVKQVFGSLNPREDITLARLSELTLAVRMLVEGATEKDRRDMPWLSYLLPPHDEEESVLHDSGVLDPMSSELPPASKAALRRLLDETSDLIESPPFAQVLALLNNEAFSHLIDNKCAPQAFGSSRSTGAPSMSSRAHGDPPSSPDSGLTSSTKLANVLAILTKQTHVIGNGTNPPNEYLSTMESGVKELEAFAAVIYSSNFEPVSALTAHEPTRLSTEQGSSDLNSAVFDRVWERAAS